ncbi:kinase-like domain-containing protein [Rhizophagus irregularis DAOM 181602=DAOM 197198]|nr:kinase-like domain-containing protein [Rhizophagus irregularis DAOM 181602=DAOM 197198]
MELIEKKYGEYTIKSITKYDNSFDPTPKLKSSPIPIKFISFNENDDNCFYCKNPYTETLLFKQKYCETCLFQYINYVDNDHKYLDVLITNNNTDHYASCLCTECVLYFKITCFKQVIATNSHHNVKFDIKKNCGLCGKLNYQDLEFIEFESCSNCYIVSSELIESTLTKSSIQILHLPWWNTHSRCIVCLKNLTFIFDCQKWCSFCNIIYTGCRHCLTTNIIFGFTQKSQCKKCNRIIFITIDITNIISGNNDLDSELLINLKPNITVSLNSVSLYRYYLNDPVSSLKWISYSNIKIIKEIAQGGFGIIYQATLLEYEDAKITVAVKKFLSSKSITKSFLSELKSYYQLCKDYRFIIKCHGITKDPITNEYMLVMDYANEGDLHNYLQNNFQYITWKRKLTILCQISEGLKVIHKINFIHRDLHSGNILLFRNINTIYDFRLKHNAVHNFWKIGDFGLSQSENDPSKNNEIYGIIDGKRPEITNDTPECFANLMKRCWDPDPSKRPYISDISDTISKFKSSCREYEPVEFSEQFHQAEENRLKLIKSKKLGPKFTEKPHSKAIYISRPLKISKSLSINKLSINVNPEYTSKEYDLDINDIQSSSSHGKNFAIQNSSNTQHPGASRPLRSLIIKSSKKLDEKLNNEDNEEYASKEYDFDINDVQRPSSSNVIFVRKSSSSLAIRKRNIEELNIIPQNNGKRIKTNENSKNEK